MGMLIRVLLRAIPLICVGVFTLGVYLVDGPGQRGQQVARLETQQLTWAVGLVKCPDPWGNLPLSACRPANEARNPPLPALSGPESVLH
ncbi:MAG: hypothetical protein QM682_12195 [Paracoccus sp. (in: a-proteobacteria)]